MSKAKYKKIAKNVFLIILLVTFIYLFSSINKQVIENIAFRLGWLGPVFIGLIFVCSHVFAPISGTAFGVVGIRLYGYGPILILFYCTSMISATLCFFIARRWGRKLVIRLVGAKTMAQIDEIVSMNETSLLVVGRTLGYFFFEFTSYALGLTKISFKKYFTYTAILTLIPSLLLYFLFKNLDFGNLKSSMIFYLFIALTGVVFAYLFKRLVRKNKRSL